MPCAFASASVAFSHAVWPGSLASSDPAELSITITRTVPPLPALSNA
jgi:hypothetical protein